MRSRRNPEELVRDHSRLASFLVELDYSRPRVTRALVVAAGCEPADARRLHREATTARADDVFTSLGARACEERERDYDRAVAGEHFVF